MVSASGFEQKITDAPASITVITREELSRRPYVTLLDAVRDVEGVDVGETRDKTGQGTISMRGMGSDYTLILVDGKRQNNHGDIYPNSFSGNQFGHVPPMDAIERIEVIRGPASTLYGADAMGGVINIITRKVAKQWGGSITHGRTFQTDEAWGNDRTTDFYLSGPLVEGKVGLALRGSLYNRNASTPTYGSITDPNGTSHTPTLGFGGGGKTVDNENRALGARLSWTPTDKQTIYLDVDTSRQTYDNKIKINDQGVEEYPVGTVDSLSAIWSASGAGATRRANPRAGYAPEQEFTRDTFSLTHEGKWDIGNSFVSLSHIATNNNGRTLPFTVEERKHLLAMIDATGYTAPDGSAYDYTGLSLADRQAAASSTFLPRPKRTLESRQYTLDGKLDMPMGTNHVVVVGTQIVRGELEDGVFGMESGQPGGVQSHNMVSLFAEDSWNVVQPLVVTSGVRYDHHNVFGSQFSPRLYGVYNLSPGWTVKGGVATGFKTPKTTQLYDGVTGFGGQGTSPQYGNPNLKPETSVSNEVAIYWQDPRGHNFNATVFHNSFDDKIANQPCGAAGQQACATAGDYSQIGYSAGSSRATNIDKVILQGLELAGRWQITSTVGLRGNYTYTDSEQKSGVNAGRPLGNSAKHMFNATLDWRALNNLNIFLSMESHAKRYRSYDATLGKDLYYKDYQVFNLGASYKATKTVTVNARIYNLLDKDFSTYQTTFTTTDGGVTYTPSYLYDYNNINAPRNLWVSMNVTF